MDWEYIIGTVVLFYLKCGFIYLAYGIAKLQTADVRTSTTPPRMERIERYAKCIGVVAIIAALASVYYHGDCNRGAIVFIALVIPVLLGVEQGFTCPKPPSNS
jgi:hypothetical protein